MSEYRFSSEELLFCLITCAQQHTTSFMTLNPDNSSCTPNIPQLILTAINLMNRILCPLAIKSISRDESFWTTDWSSPFLGTSNTFPSLITEKQEFGMGIVWKKPKQNTSFFKTCRLDKIKCIQNRKKCWCSLCYLDFLSVKNSIISKLPKVSSPRFIQNWPCQCLWNYLMVSDHSF